MNIKYILLSVLAVAVLTLAAVTASVEQKDNPHYTDEQRREVVKEEAKGGKEYNRSLYVNQITGVLDPADVQAAIDHANRMRGQNYKTRGVIPNLEWVSRGPDNIGGRTRSILCDQTDSNLLYMGMVTGGFWRSIDGGNTWVQLAGNDSLERLSVCCITQAANGDVYFGTGESFTGPFPGNGIYKSTDKGLTFTHLPSTDAPWNATSSPWHFVNEMKAHPTDANKIYAATAGGLFVTTDAGATWNKAISGQGQSSSFTDVEMSSTGNTILGATVNNIFLSTDGGANFAIINDNTLNNGLPGTSGVARVELAISPSDENYIYAVMSDNNEMTKGVYRTTNKGVQWTTIGQGGTQLFNPLGTQGTYNIAFAVHPTNKDILFLGGQFDLFRWTPSTAWDAIANWRGSVQGGTYVHADMHEIVFNSANANRMYVGSDGGFARTEDCTVADPFFIEKNKDYVTTQCYGLSVNRLGHIIIGTQDNGSNLMNGSLANSPNTATDQLGGDGMPNALSDINTDVLFASSQNGNLRRATDGGVGLGSYSSIYDLNIDADANNASAPGHGRPDEGAIFTAPVVLKEDIAKGKSVLFVGLQNNVWFTQDALNTPTVWFPLITVPHTQFNGFCSMALSADGKVAYAGSTTGKLYRITGLDMFNKTYTYDFTTNLLSDGFSERNQFMVEDLGSFGRRIQGIDCSYTGDTLLFCLPNYGNSQYVYRSTNALASTAVARNITSIQGIGPVTNRLPAMPVFSIVMLSEPNCYLAGTDLGVWGTEDGGASWRELNNIANNPNFNTWHPRLSTREIVVKQMVQEKDGSGYSKDIIYTATYGRGTFRSTSASQFWPTSTKNISRASETFNVYPNPVNDIATIDYDAKIGGQATVMITSLSGSVIKNVPVNLTTGGNSLKVDMSNLTRGVYFLSISSSNGKGSAKVVKR